MAIKKKFISVEIPILSNSISVLGTPETLERKTIKLDLTRMLRGKSLEAIFEIFIKDKEAEKPELVAYPKNMKLMTQYIRRMIRKNSSYVEDSFEVSCKDIKCVVKPFLITRKRVSRAVRRNLRNTTKELIQKYFKEKNYLEICNDVIHRIFQQSILPKLKKVYPLSLCEIRVIETKELGKADKKPVEPVVDSQFNQEESIQVAQEEEEVEDIEDIIKDNE
jgi:ribosomal protein S3AE